jgi:hypothetical protein
MRDASSDEKGVALQSEVMRHPGDAVIVTVG